METEEKPPTPQLLTFAVLATMKSEDGKGHACPNVLIYDPHTRTNIECTVWVYPRTVYHTQEDAFIFSDVLSDDDAYQRARQKAIRDRTEEPQYQEYHRHLRVGSSPHQGSAIISREIVERILRTGQYTVS